MGTRIATVILEEVLAGIPTMFGKLAWISSFRVAGSEEYRCADLEDIVDPQIASSVLRDLHNRVFASWLTLPLEEQTRDFTAHLEALQTTDGPKEALFGQADELIPPRAKLAEKSLFETDFALMLECAEK